MPPLAGELLAGGAAEAGGGEALVGKIIPPGAALPGAEGGSAVVPSTGGGGAGGAAAGGVSGRLGNFQHGASGATEQSPAPIDLGGMVHDVTARMRASQDGT